MDNLCLFLHFFLSIFLIILFIFCILCIFCILSFYLSIYRSIPPSIHPCMHPSIHPSIHPCIKSNHYGKLRCPAAINGVAQLSNCLGRGQKLPNLRVSCRTIHCEGLHEFNLRQSHGYEQTTFGNRTLLWWLEHWILASRKLVWLLHFFHYWNCLFACWCDKIWWNPRVYPSIWQVETTKPWYILGVFTPVSFSPLQSGRHHCQRTWTKRCGHEGSEGAAGPHVWGGDGVPLVPWPAEDLNKV